MSSTRGAIDRPITYQGVWNSALTYHPRMVVTYLNTTYMCVARNTNSQPSILLTTPWLPMGSSGSVVQSTVGAGLPSAIGRAQGDFHYNTTDKKEYVLVGTPLSQYAGDTFTGPDNQRLRDRAVTEIGARPWTIVGGDGGGPRIYQNTATDSAFGNTALIGGYGGGPVTMSLKIYINGYTSQNAATIYLGVTPAFHAAGVSWNEHVGLTLFTTTGDVVLPNPTGCPPCVDRNYVDPGQWRTAQLTWDTVQKEVTLWLAGVTIGSWFLDPYTITDGGYSGFSCSVSQGSDQVDDMILYTGVPPVWTPVWVDPGSVPTSVVDAKGDLIVGTADNVVARQPISGTNGRVLTEDSTTTTGVRWGDAPATGVAVQDENTTIASGATQLDFQGAGVQAAAGTGEVVVTIPGPAGIVTAKGQLIVGTGPASIALLPVGTDTYVLTADATQASGIKWALASAGGITVQDENVTLGSGVTQLDFQGAGVTATVGTGGEIVVTVPGAGADTTATHYKGAWGSGTAYAVGDLVTKLYQLYVATLPSTGSDPTAIPGAVITETAGTNMSPNGFWGMYTIAQQFILTSPVSVDSLSYLCRTTSTANGNMKIGVATALGATENLVTWLNIGGVEVSTNLLPSGDPALGTSAMRTGGMSGRVTIPAGTYYFVCKGTSGVGAYRPSINNITGIGALNITLPNNGIYTASAANGAYTNQTTTSALQFQLGTGSVSAWTKIADFVPTAVQSKTAAYPMDPLDAVVLANGTFSVTLPPVATAKIGYHYSIKNIGTGTVTITPASGTLDGGANKVISVQYSSISVITDGTNWYEV